METNNKKTNKESCIKQNVPQEDKRSFQVQPEDVMFYYKIDDECNFQTLQTNVYIDIRNGKLKKRPFFILGRFASIKSSKEGEYFINKLEAKIYELLVPPLRPKKRYKIEKITVSPTSTPADITFKMHLIEDKNWTPKDKVDYIYGNKPNEPAVLIRSDAKLSFEDTGLKRPSGGYECNGKVITGG